MPRDRDRILRFWRGYRDPQSMSSAFPSVGFAPLLLPLPVPAHLITLQGATGGRGLDGHPCSSLYLHTAFSPTSCSWLLTRRFFAAAAHAHAALLLFSIANHRRRVPQRPIPPAPGRKTRGTGRADRQFSAGMELDFRPPPGRIRLALLPSGAGFFLFSQGGPPSPEPAPRRLGCLTPTLSPAGQSPAGCPAPAPSSSGPEGRGASATSVWACFLRHGRRPCAGAMEAP